MYSAEGLTMLCGIQYMAFCENQWAAIHIEQKWAQNIKNIEV